MEKQLTPEQYEVRRRKGKEQNLIFHENIMIPKKKEYIDVYAVVVNYSVQITNSIQELDGPVSHNQSNLKMSRGS